MALTLTTSLDYNKWYSVNSQFCLCFSDSAYLTNGVSAFWTFTFSALPTDGQNFQWFDTTYVFKNTPVLPNHIQIGATLADNITNTATALSLHPQSSYLEFFYFVAPFLGFFTLIALCAGTEAEIDFTTGTSPFLLSTSGAGVSLSTIQDYTVRIVLDILADTVAQVGPPQHRRIDNLYAIPVLNELPNCQASVEMCTDIAPFLRGAISNEYLEYEASLGSISPTLWYEWVAVVYIRYWVDLGGVATLPATTLSDTLSFLNARESDYIPNWTAYHPQPVARSWFWLVNNRDNLVICVTGSNPLRTAFHLFMPHVHGQITTTWDLTITATPDTGFATATITSFSIIRDTILQVPILLGSTAGTLSDFTGIITLTVTETGGGTRESDTLSIRFVGGSSGCYDRINECSSCTTTFRFLNKFGVWETFQASCEQTFGVTVSSSTFIPFTPCGAPNKGVSPYSQTYGEVFTVNSRKIDMDDDEERAALIDFLTSPEIYVLGKRTHTPPFGNSQRVVLDFSDIVLKESAGKSFAQVVIKYKLAAENIVNVNV
jgi:hypothetical protein